MPVSEETYKRVVLEDTDHVWELVCGRLREKPPMTAEHDDSGRTLAVIIGRQIDLREFTVGTNSGRVRISTGTFYVPDVAVIPRSYINRLKERPGTFEVYEEPLPLVVEIWSPSTGAYDVASKLAEYRLRGHQEIWRIHPYERTLIAWRRQPDGTYTETLYTGGTVEPVALPGVTIDLAALFE
jgi:Uma2 family endonuclease